MDDLGNCLANRVQLTTDGISAYRNAVDSTFGNSMDFGQLIKLYSTPDVRPARKYNPRRAPARAECLHMIPGRAHVSTSFAESHNKKMRQHLRRFTRLTAGNSKKFANHARTIGLYTTWYNFVK
jgi:IS1 family transposase